MMKFYLSLSTSIANAIKEYEVVYKINVDRHTLKDAFNRELGNPPSYFLAKPKFEHKITDNGTVEQISKIVKLCKSQPRDLEYVCNELKLCPSDAKKLIDKAIEEGYSIGIDGNKLAFNGLQQTNTHSINFPKAQKDIIFAAISDTHVGSKHYRPHELESFILQAYEEGVRDVFHAGDVVDGANVFPGQEYELEHHGLDAQVEQVVSTFPKFPDMKYHYIDGNHDGSFKKKSGQLAGKYLEHVSRATRDDMHYLGECEASVYFGGSSDKEGVLIQLHHPRGASAYASSYRLQRRIDSFMGGLKPQILLSGHDHEVISLFRRNIFAFKTASFQGQSLFAKEKSLAPCIGGWIITASVADDFSIRKLSSRFIPYYGSEERRIYA